MDPIFMVTVTNARREFFFSKGVRAHMDATPLVYSMLCNTGRFVAGP